MIKRLTSWFVSDKVFFTTFFLIALSWHFYHALLGWNLPLLDHHEFRQTQTAITADYFVREGFRINYITPVLGKPWMIPLEFPVYQMLVAALVRLTHFPLDQTGRFVSLFFFYLCLIPAHKILGYKIQERTRKLFVLSFILISPLYIFWSRTFMIESCVLFLSLTFTASALRAIQTQAFKHLFAAAFFGSVAAIAKVTTFGLFLIIPSFYYLYKLIPKLRFKNSSFSMIQESLLLSAVFLFPVIAAGIWLHTADALKDPSTLSAYLISSTLRDWTLGTWEQKFSIKTWETFGRWILNLLGLSSSATHLLPLGMSALLILRFISCWEISLGFLLFITGPLVFTNLYVVHDYYWYANSAFLLVVLGIALLKGIEQSPTSKMPGKLFSVLVLTLMLQGYSPTYGFLQTQKHQDFTPIVEAIQRNTSPEKALLIYGEDWNPRIPYYAKRKALMLPGYLNATDEKYQKTVALFEKSEVGAILITKNGNFNKFDEITHQSLRHYEQQSIPGFRKALWQHTPETPTRFVDLSGDFFDELRQVIRQFDLSKDPVYEDPFFVLYGENDVQKL